MEKHNFNIIECSRQTASTRIANPAVSIPFELDLYGESVAFEAVCLDSHITLKDIAHPSHQLSDVVVRKAIAYQRRIGNPISCSTGCSACCKYAINVSLAEAFAINDMICQLPRESEQAILGKLAKAGKQLLKSYAKAPNSSQLVEFSRWYSAMDLSCPWLEKKLCSEYSRRPLVCREFLVTSSPNQCSLNVPFGRTIVDLPIKMAEVLMAVCSKLTHTNLVSIFLALVTAECETYAHLQNICFDSRQAAGLLIETIVEHQKSVAASTAACC
jgi:Fe-S-cluster containining protein